MIRGPVLPQLRASVWAKMAGRLANVERGLELLLEGVDCSAGQFGLVEGLARDAMGAPVLVLVADDADGLLTARAHAACDFLARIGDSLPAAVPEANLVAGVRGRVLVIGTEAGADSLERLCRLPLPGLEVCRVEMFRIAGSERMSVRWLDTDGVRRAASGATRVACLPEFEAPGPFRSTWDELRQLCERIDPGIAWDGDRFSRRLTWQGRGLGRIVVADGELWGLEVAGAEHADCGRVAAAARGVPAPVHHPLRDVAEARRFCDRLLRRYAQVAGLYDPQSAPPAGGPAPNRVDPEAGSDPRPLDAQAEHAAETPPGADASGAAAALRSGDIATLRSTLSTTRLSAEEYSALGGPTAVGGAEAEYGNIADDVAKIVTAEGGPWHVPRRTD